MGSPFPRQSNSYLFVVVRKIKENADKRTKKTHCLQASGTKSDQLLFHTSSSRTGGISHWANRDHMLTWLQTGWLRGMSHPWNISKIFTEPNPHWLSTVAGLGCQGGSALLLRVLCDVDEHKRLRHQLCRCLCLLPTSVGHLEGLQTCWAAAAPSGCPKKAAGKNLWFQHSFFFSGRWLLQVASHQLISFQWDFRNLDASINTRNTIESHQDSWSTGFLHSAVETILPSPRGKPKVKMGKSHGYYWGN